MKHKRQHGASRQYQQRGMSLVVVLIILIVVSVLGVAASQIALQAQRSARNDRDLQMALQSANLALQDANTEIFKPENSRASNFAVSNAAAFPATCGTSGDARGLCAEQAAGVTPAWLKVDLNSDSATVPYGTYSGAALTLPDATTVGVYPAKKPRYVVERVGVATPEQGANLEVLAGQSAAIDKVALFRVTALGYGPRDDIVAVTQSVIRKPADS